MSQTHTLAVPTRTRALRFSPLVIVILAAGLLALALFQFDGGDTPAPNASAGEAVTSSGLPAPAARPDEAKIAAALAAGVTPGSAGRAGWSGRPDESTVAAAVAPASHGWSGRPDESTTAAAIGRSD
jgi:hypothetical protein